MCMHLYVHGIYVHMNTQPFPLSKCPQPLVKEVLKCSFCPFYSITGTSYCGVMVNALDFESGDLSSYLGETVPWGRDLVSSDHETQYKRAVHACFSIARGMLHFTAWNITTTTTPTAYKDLGLIVNFCTTEVSTDLHLSVGARSRLWLGPSSSAKLHKSPTCQWNHCISPHSLISAMRRLSLCVCVCIEIVPQCKYQKNVFLSIQAALDGVLKQKNPKS